MKKFAVVFTLIFLGLNLSAVFAQSHRTATDSEPAKTNKRPPAAAAAPSPTPPAPSEASAVNQPADSTAVDDGDVIKVDTNLVTIPVKVSDRSNRFIAGLKKEDFKVFEDNQEQEIALFSNEEQPFTVALVLDMSYSTTFKVTEIQAAAIAFINQLRPNDKVMVVSFDEEVHLLCEPTGDRARLASAIKGTKISTGTSLYEAVSLVLNKRLNKIEGRKAIVLFTDGVDTTSRRDNDLSNESDVQESDAVVYPLQYDTYADVQKMKNQTVVVPPTLPGQIPSSQNKSPFPFPFPSGGIGTANQQGTSAEDYRKAGEYLNELANLTGGRLYQASSTGNLAQAFSNIASELREFYSIGYYPKNDKQNGKKRRIKVKVDRQNISVRARDSYSVKK